MHPLFYIAIAAPAVPMVTGLIRWRRLDGGQWVLLGLLLFYLVNQLVGLVLSHHGLSNYPLFHLHVVVEAACMPWVFHQAGGLSLQPKYVWGTIGAFTASALANAVLGGGILTTPSIPLVVESLLFILMVSVYFWKVYRESLIERVEKEFLFWISLGILVFFAGTLLLSFTMKLILAQDDRLFFEVFLIRNVLILLTNICYAIGMSCKAHPQKS